MEMGPELAAAMRVLHRFNSLDQKMQVSTILTLLEIAAAEFKGEDISTRALEQRVGMLSGTASRNVYYWGEGHKDMRGGHEMVNIGFAVDDKRKRSLRLTHKGKAFIRQLEGARQ